MKLNKIITGLAAIAILSLFFGCASTDDGVKEVVFDSEDTVSVESEEEEEQEIDESDALLVTADEESSQTIVSDVPLSAKETKKNYTGWVSTSIRPITNEIGNIKINVRPKKGTFSIAAINENGKAIPVLSTANEYTTTSFYLKAGKKILKLCDDSNVSSAAKKTANGVSILYTIDKTATVQIDFICFSSVEGENEDSVKIVATVTSLAKKKQDYALKLILDTVLGETDRHHFYTSENAPVKGEVLYHSMQDNKWIVSKNAKANLQIILDGEGITPVESVAIANYSTLDTKKWEADMTTFRSFDTVLSYNNSAVGIYWPAVKLEPEDDMSSIFYVSLAAGEKTPGGAAFIVAQSAEVEEEEASAQEKPVTHEATETVKEEPKVQNIQAVKEEDVKTEPKKEEPKKEEPKKEEPKVTEPKTTTPQTEPEEPKPQSVPAVEEKTPSTDSGISLDKLSVDYIQQLLDRIESLEEDGSDTNKEEINALNAELDAILTILNAN